MFAIGKRFTFDAAHSLPHLPANHKCSRVHGHTYTVEVELAADELSPDGFVRDYAELSAIKQWLDDNLDHRYLNDVVVDMPTTAECLARYLYRVAKNLVPEVVAVTVRETPNTWATYRP